MRPFLNSASTASLSISMPSREHHEIIELSGGSDLTRERYEELKLLRITQPEREAAAARKALEKHTAASDALVASLRAQLATAQPSGACSGADVGAEAALRAENAELRSKLEEAQTAAAAQSAAPPAAATADAPSESIAALEAKISFYEMMTGMSVELASGDIAKCVIRCVVPSEEDEEAATQTAPRCAAFELHLSPKDGDEGDVEYVPTDVSSVDDKLPEFLLDSIVFEAPQAPGFLAKLLAGVAP